MPEGRGFTACLIIDGFHIGKLGPVRLYLLLMVPKLCRINADNSRLSNIGIIVASFPQGYVGKSYGDLESYYGKQGESKILVGLLLNGEGRCNEPLLTPATSYVIPKNSKSILVCTNENS